MPTSSGLKDLVRNPLGIVALFISLIYGVASLLLGATASSLSPEERTPLIGFVTLFPLVVLGAFYLLVTRHHGKLYAPGDFQNDDSFLRTLSTEEVELRRQAEANEALPSVETGLSDPATEIPAFSISNRDSELASASANLAGTSFLAPESSPLSRFLEEVRRTEIEVIARLEKEFGHPLTRSVEIAKAGVSFDAFIPGGVKPTFAEVKLISRPTISGGGVDKVLYSALLADRALNGNFKLILIVVYTFPKSELQRIERAWRQRVEKCPADIELRFLPRDEIVAQIDT